MAYTPRRSQDEWQSIIYEYLTSGLTVKAFCESKGIKIGVFTKWKRRLTAVSGHQTTGPALIKLKPTVTKSHSHCSQKVTYFLSNGCSMSWNESVDPEYIANVLRVLNP